jgi:hypothetical protein
MIKINTYENAEKKDIFQIYKEICQQNDEMIKSRENIIPFAFVVYENKLDIIGLMEDFKKIKIELLNYISTKKIKGYITITEADLGIYKDCVFRALYTKDNSIKEIVFRIGNQIIKKEIINGRNNFLEDSLDFWNNFRSNHDLIINSTLLR